MFLRPNYRRPCRCVACGKPIDDAESIHNLGGVVMSIVTSQDLTDKSRYRGFKIEVVVSHCKKCQKRSKKVFRIGCLVSIAIILLGVILSFNTHNDEQAIYLYILGVAITLIINFFMRESADAGIVREMDRNGFVVGARNVTKPKVYREMTPHVIRRLLIKLCAKYDYVLCTKDGEEIVSVDALRDKGVIADAVFDERTSNTIKLFDFDVDVDEDMDVDLTSSW